MSSDTAKVFVISGPSGAGKDTLIRKALEEVPGLHYSVSATTRPPREGEVEGKDYYFVSDEEFDLLVRSNGLLEWEDVFGRRYGTPRSELERAAAEGRDLILELDYKGALNVRSSVEGAKLVFIMPPSLEHLESRLKGRDKDGEDDIEKRTRLAPLEMEVGEKEFDFVIVNDDAEQAAEELAAILRGERV